MKKRTAPKKAVKAKKAAKAKNVASKRSLPIPKIEKTHKDVHIDGEIKALEQKEGGKFKVKVTLNAQIFETETDDIVDALLALNTPLIKGKVLVWASNGTKQIERPMFVAEARRVLRNRLSAQFFVKNLLVALQ